MSKQPKRGRQWTKAATTSAFSCLPVRLHDFPQRTMEVGISGKEMEGERHHKWETNSNESRWMIFKAKLLLWRARSCQSLGTGSFCTFCRCAGRQAWWPSASSRVDERSKSVEKRKMGKDGSKLIKISSYLANSKTQEGGEPVRTARVIT